MNYAQMNNNRVELTGIVSKKPEFSHEVFGEGFYETEIEVARLSAQTDKIPLTISERLLAEHHIETGSKVSIMGQFRSYNKPDGERSRLMLTVFVREVIPESEATNPNSIVLSGYICKDPVYRVTPFKREICDLLLAVNRSYNKSDYIPCITWGRNAKYVKNLPIGEKITIDGRIQSRVYHKTHHDGTEEERTAYEVSVGKILVGQKPALDEDGIDADELSELI